MNGIERQTKMDKAMELLRNKKISYAEFLSMTKFIEKKTVVTEPKKTNPPKSTYWDLLNK